MQLVDLRNEVLNRGFSPSAYASRITQFLNDAQNLVAREVDYYNNETDDPFSTVAGTPDYPLPTGWARVRELAFVAGSTPFVGSLEEVSIRDIDNSPSVTGVPAFFALDGQNMHLYPTPDGVYTLQLRYWAMPPVLVNDTDVPNLPTDWHYILWEYAVWRTFEADDDDANGQYWKAQFLDTLSRLSADARFPSTDYPTQAKSMWNRDEPLMPRGGSWTMFGW